MWNSIESASGCTWTTATSLPSSLAYSLNAIRRGSFASMKAESSGARLFSYSSLPSLSLLVAMKMKGPGISAPFRCRWARPRIGPRPLGRSGQGVPDVLDRLSDCGAGGVRATQRVEHHEVVDDALIARRGDVDAGLAQPAGVRRAFVTKHVGLAGDHQRLRQTSELLGGRL